MLQIPYYSQNKSELYLIDHIEGDTRAKAMARFIASINLFFKVDHSYNEPIYNIVGVHSKKGYLEILIDGDQKPHSEFEKLLRAMWSNFCELGESVTFINIQTGEEI